MDRRHYLQLPIEHRLKQEYRRFSSHLYIIFCLVPHSGSIFGSLGCLSLRATVASNHICVVLRKLDYNDIGECRSQQDGQVILLAGHVSCCQANV